MTIEVLHLGFGRVGQELIRQISSFENVFESRLGVSLKFSGIFRSNCQLVDRNGLSAGEILKKIEMGFSEGNSFLKELDLIKNPFIVIDTTGSDLTYSLLIKSLKKGAFLVLSNKKPLTGKFDNYQELLRLGDGRIFFETVVGAGLPIIKTVKELQSTGDEILEIQGAFSGTLGFIFSEIQQGRKFSEAVIDAKKRGFTEPDPRDDLSGLDMARKALILSRLLGLKLEMSDIKLTGMVTESLANLSADEFLQNLSELDYFYFRRIKKAQSKDKTLRFIVKIKNSQSFARLQEVSVKSDVGNLRGPDNIVVIKSKRYFKNPLVIKGPGAGIEVTAGGVFADLLEAIRTIKQRRIGSEVSSLPFQSL